MNAVSIQQFIEITGSTRDQAIYCLERSSNVNQAINYFFEHEDEIRLLNQNEAHDIGHHLSSLSDNSFQDDIDLALLQIQNDRIRALTGEPFIPLFNEDNQSNDNDNNDNNDGNDNDDNNNNDNDDNDDNNNDDDNDNSNDQKDVKIEETELKLNLIEIDPALCFLKAHADDDENLQVDNSQNPEAEESNNYPFRESSIQNTGKTEKLTIYKNGFFFLNHFYEKTKPEDYEEILSTLECGQFPDELNAENIFDVCLEDMRSQLYSK